MPIDPSTAFVSYSREDLEFVRRLAKDLKAKGANVWMDKIDILPGQPWDDKVEIAVERCERMIVVLSPTSVASAKVKNEFMDALDLGKTVIPVLFRECKIPQQLKRLQYADFREDYDTGLAELLASLTALGQATESAIASQARLEEANTLAALSEQFRLEKEEFERQRVAAEQARRDEERKQAAAEQARLEREERECKAAEVQARLEEQERQRIAAEQARMDQERKPNFELPIAAPARLSARTRGGIAAGVVVVAGLLAYWVHSHATKQATENKPPEATAAPQQVAHPQTNSSLQSKQPESSQLQGSTQTAMAENKPKKPPISGQSLPKSKTSSGASQPESPTTTQKAPLNNRPSDSTASEIATPPAAAQPSLDIPSQKTPANPSPSDATTGTQKPLSDEMQTPVPPGLSDAVAESYRKAKAGDTSAMTDVGLAYEYGRGATMDYLQAFKWYLDAAIAGNTRAMNNMGRLYSKGLGVDRDYRKAFNWYQKSATAGDPYGMENLAEMYEHGLGVQMDRNQAVAWYRKAARLGNGHASSRLKYLGENP